MRLAISQRWELPQFTHRRNDVIKSLKRYRGDSDDDENEVPVNKLQILDSDNIETAEVQEILECEVITDFTPENDLKFDNCVNMNDVSSKEFVHSHTDEHEELNLELNDLINSELEKSELENQETYDNEILMNRVMSDEKLKSYYDLFHKDSFLCNLITRLEDAQLLTDFIVLVKELSDGSVPAKICHWYSLLN